MKSEKRGRIQDCAKNKLSSITRRRRTCDVPDRHPDVWRPAPLVNGLRFLSSLARGVHAGRSLSQLFIFKNVLIEAGNVLLRLAASAEHSCAAEPLN